MKKSNFILFTLLALLLINSCDWFDFDKDVKSRGRSKREITEEEKTPEELLKEKLNEGQRKGLEFFKKSLKNKSDFDKFLNFDESEIKQVLNHIQSEIETCKNNNDLEEGKDRLKIAIQNTFEIDNYNFDEFKKSNGCVNNKSEISKKQSKARFNNKNVRQWKKVKDSNLNNAKKTKQIKNYYFNINYGT
ncbi:Mlp family lipoprotein [Borrelia puertoricensis]|uniref:Mlp family lipoprotein n=1 Tax=Borrelia puertoricensis TaxID=2756107 RepID=UPI001FF4283B|nr:Mlp family lipoprotein [Borrelia puertoricensis]UPA18628.1 Mlp family lipoprotein [Borrelia puertoricensis]